MSLIGRPAGTVRNAWMRPTFDIVAEIIALTCEVPRERITLDSNLVNDLGIDSLDLLDITFAIDDAFGIVMPINQWLRAVHMGRISSDQYLVMRGFCANIDALMVAATA
jgi:acyl carrier protein